MKRCQDQKARKQENLSAQTHAKSVQGKLSEAHASLPDRVRSLSISHY